ncbi:MAG: YqgE/AlgH family protein [Thermoanaerobaculia bacterium]
MAETPTDLRAPILLLAMPQVLDSFFHRSVVVLLRHTEEGSFGFIVNRPTEIPLTAILKGMEISWQGEDDVMVYFGGPVQSQLGSVMFTQRADDPQEVDGDENSMEVCPGIGMTQHLDELGRLARDPPERFRLYLGYAGWGAGQLVREIMRNDWLTAPVQDELLFSSHPGEVWEKALKSVGVDPASLPSWTPGGGDEPTN